MNDRDAVLLEDLANEVQSLDALLATLTPEQWHVPTPAPGWNVADQVIHLGLFDRRCMWSMVNPERFAKKANPDIAANINNKATNI